jgi:hypothetical protein
MKIEIWDKDQKEEEQPLRLRLEREFGNIYLNAVDAKGHRIIQGRLLVFRPDGCFERCHRVNTTLGLQLDDVDRVEVIQ